MGDFIKISFLGDVLCSIPESEIAKKGENEYDYSPVFCNVRNYLEGSDYVVANLETPLAGQEMNYTSETTLFNTPTSFAKALKEAGVNLVTTANNHALDRGVAGLKATIANLNSINLAYTGTRTKRSEKNYFLVEIKGCKIAFISFTYGTESRWRNNELLDSQSFMLNLFRKQEPFPIKYKKNKTKEILKLVVPEFIKRIGRDSTYLDCGVVSDIYSPQFEYLISTIEDAKKEADVVALCLHIGGQYNRKIGDYTESVIEKCKEAGCDIIIGNHPHCIQKSSLDSHFIAYALGNFLCTPNWGYYLEGVYADYSIILNVIIDNNTHKISDITFSVGKSVVENGHTKVRLLSDIYEVASLTEKRKLEKDCNNVLSRFMGYKINGCSIKREYAYKNFISDK